MEQVDRLAEVLGGALGDAVRQNAASMTELRLRSGRPARLIRMGGAELTLETVDQNRLHRILERLMENSLYAWEDELRQGYFTAAGGLRVGVCGHMSPGRDALGRITSIGSACIRIPREVKGCAAPLMEKCMGDRPAGTLILSPPGLGKTTLLRDLARSLSEAGWNVGLADERREIAACREGVPQLDVGARTDVMDACPKGKSIPMLVRACAPDVIAADEIGGECDMEAIRDAACAGVAVVATAHAPGLREAKHRKNIAPLIAEGAFDWAVTLGQEPGKIRSIEKIAGEAEGC